MKLKNEYAYCYNQLKNKTTKEKLLNYKEYCKNTQTYKNFDIYFCNLVMNQILTSDCICNWYDKYECNDNHITTLFINVVNDFLS